MFWPSFARSRRALRLLYQLCPARRPCWVPHSSPRVTVASCLAPLLSTNTRPASLLISSMCKRWAKSLVAANSQAWPVSSVESGTLLPGGPSDSHSRWRSGMWHPVIVFCHSLKLPFDHSPWCAFVELRWLFWVYSGTCSQQVWRSAHLSTSASCVVNSS
jgi:hypothetical protein